MWINGASHSEFDGSSLETKTTTWSEFPNGGKDSVEEILASEEINKFKIRQPSEYGHLRQKNYSRVQQVNQFHRNR